ncbi:MAG: hypothetical protein KF784_04795 [Fimbriimonadaceae bacterium]|nr:hypothetical protein [Fimbriimonadaceae bacterium]
MQLTILHTNDFHGSLNATKAEFIRSLKLETDGPILYCDSGDCIKAGNLAIPLKPDPAWGFLGDAGCDIGVIGNRESHVLEGAFAKKITGHRHPLVCANLRKKSGGHPLPMSHIFELSGLKVGVIGVMVPMVTERMATAAASAYLWDAPIPVADQQAQTMRGGVDCLIALTHIGYRQDQELAEKCPLIDIILGGHSHTILESPARVGDTFICQGGSHGKYIGRYIWEAGKGIVSSALVELPK